MVFKPNGDVVAVYESATESEVNPWAGELHYIYSTDEGLTWSTPEPVHEDRTPGKGRGFFDAALLPNGEAGVAWLDASYPDGG